MSKPNEGTYQACACEWADGKVISLCAAHHEVLRRWEDRLAVKYRKLTETRPPEGIQHPEWGYDAHGVWVRKP